MKNNLKLLKLWSVGSLGCNLALATITPEYIAEHLKDENRLILDGSASVETEDDAALVIAAVSSHDLEEFVFKIRGNREPIINVLKVLRENVSSLRKLTFSPRYIDCEELKKLEKAQDDYDSGFPKRMNGAETQERRDEIFHAYEVMNEFWRKACLEEKAKTMDVVAEVIKTCPKLKVIDFSGNKCVSIKMDRISEAIRQNSNLDGIELSLSDCGLNSGDPLGVLFNGLQGKNVESLDVSGNWLREKTYRLEEITKLNTLKHVNFSGCFLHDTDFDYIVIGLRKNKVLLSSLESIKLTRNFLQKSGDMFRLLVNGFADIQKEKSTRKKFSIYASDCHIQGSDWIPEAISRGVLKKLDLAKNPMEIGSLVFQAIERCWDGIEELVLPVGKRTLKISLEYTVE